MILALLLAAAVPILPGAWTTTITAGEMTVPGVPGFLLRLARGRTRTETKCLSPADAATGAAVLIAPPPQSLCRFDRQATEGGKVDQLLSCPQKEGGDPLHIASTGSYSGERLTAHILMTRATPKGAVRIVAEQVSVHTGPCGR